MKLSELKSKIQRVNADLFSKMFRSESLADFGDSSRIFGENGLAAESNRRFCGIVRELVDIGAEHLRYITIEDSSALLKKGHVAVGAVIDGNPAEDKDLPVVVAFGINYGQGAWYLNNSVPIVGSTGMRPKLDAVINCLVTTVDCETGEVRPDGPYHLVAANIFPWITTVSWSSLPFNAIEEALFIYCYSNRDPADHLLTVINAVGADLTSLVFHGANNAVPSFGVQFVQTHYSNLGRRFNIVFCDNLARGGNSIYNAAQLCVPFGRSALAHTDFDE